MDAGFAGLLALANATLTAALIVVLRPLLLRYALARPNARSLHATPTPQGGGAAIVLALGVTLGLALALRPFAPADARILAHVLLAASALAIVGAIDDIRPIPSLPRLLMQLALAWVALAALPDAARIAPFLPPLAERLVLVVALAWFVNLSNFMDGMDWLTVVEMAPLCAALLGFAALGFLPWGAALLLAALLGGLIGFAPFNAPAAKLFLGDVGSLAIGLVVGFCLILLAGNGGLAAALLLPMYYVADSGLTLVWRLSRGERVWRAHRSHFYQTAVARGMGVRGVLARVFALNAALIALAFASLWLGAPGQAACVALGAASVAAVLNRLARPPLPQAAAAPRLP